MRNLDALLSPKQNKQKNCFSPDCAKIKREGREQLRTQCIWESTKKAERWMLNLENIMVELQHCLQFDLQSLVILFSSKVSTPSALCACTCFRTLSLQAKLIWLNQAYLKIWMSEMQNNCFNELCWLACTLCWFWWRDLVSDLKAWTAKSDLESYPACPTLALVFDKKYFREKLVWLNVSQSSLKVELPQRERAVWFPKCSFGIVHCRNAVKIMSSFHWLSSVVL